MNNDLYKSIYDSKEIMSQKSTKIDAYLKIEEENILNQEVEFLNKLINRLSFVLPRDNFSCKYGILLYEFDHKDENREVYISPSVYLIEADCVVYEVLNPKEYLKVSNYKQQILISKDGTYFCEIPLKELLKYVTVEEIVSYITKYINQDYNELLSLEKRQLFLNKFDLL